MEALPRDMIIEVLTIAAEKNLDEYVKKFNDINNDFITYGTNSLKKFITIKSPWAGINRLCRAWANAYRAFAEQQPTHRLLSGRRYAPDHQSGQSLEFKKILYRAGKKEVINQIVILPKLNVYIWLGDKTFKYSDFHNRIVIFTGESICCITDWLESRRRLTDNWCENVDKIFGTCDVDSIDRHMFNEFVARRRAL
jgi:hypothetical protein